jgi:tetratricopeptide (TPR) repeat protein
VKRSRSKLSKDDLMAVENLIACALANFMCAGTGLPGFGNVDSAQESLLEVLRIDPQNLEAMNLLAQCCAQTRRHDEAWSYFLKEIDAAKKKDDVVKLTCALAEVYEKRKAYRRAIRLYREALTRHEDPRLHVGLGYCFGKISRFAESVRHHRRAAELAPKDAKCSLSQIRLKLSGAFARQLRCPLRSSRWRARPPGGPRSGHFVAPAAPGARSSALLGARRSTIDSALIASLGRLAGRSKSLARLVYLGRLTYLSEGCLTRDQKPPEVNFSRIYESEH